MSGNTATELKEIYIGEHKVRSRDGSDLWEWFSGIDSIVFPTSFKGITERNGVWEDCLVSGKISTDNKDKIQMCLFFSDATLLSVCQLRQAYLPLGFTDTNPKQKRSR